MSFALRTAVPVRFSLRLSLVAIVVAATGLAAFDGQGAVAARPSARAVPITDPTQLRRLDQSDLVYLGAFRLPPDQVGDTSFSFGGAQVAFNPKNGSLFVGTHDSFVAEVSIPAPVNSSDVQALPVARLIQPFTEPSNGHIKSEIPGEGVSLSGLIVHDGRLIGTAVIYYDATNAQAVSHFSRPVTLSDAGATRLVRLGPRGKSGFVAGYMAAVPPEWQSALGAAFVTGQCCLPIISRTSWGPSAFAFDPADVEAGEDGKAQPLVYYDSDHPTLGPWQGSNPTYGGTTEIGGVALISGTRTALFFGRNGTGPFCYGIGTTDRSRVPSFEGEDYCLDPIAGDKGPHAPPYRYQIWAYDLSEMASVRAGHRAPWDVKPYAVWPLELPLEAGSVRIGGVAYDIAGHRLFIAQQQADRDGYAFRSVIHVYQTP